MKTLSVNISDDLAAELEGKDNHYLSQILRLGLTRLKMEESLCLLRNGEISIGYAAELAGVRRDEMAALAHSQGLEPSFSDATLKEELGE